MNERVGGKRPIDKKKSLSLNRELKILRLLKCVRIEGWLSCLFAASGWARAEKY